MKHKDMKILKYNPEYAVEIADVHYDAVHTISTTFYSREQLEAWAATPTDYDFWHDWLNEARPCVCLVDGRVAGFIELTEDGCIKCLYSHPDFQRQGVASALYVHIENVAVNANLQSLTVYASKASKGFFLKRGYEEIKVNQVERKGLVLINYHMVKTL